MEKFIVAPVILFISLAVNAGEVRLIESLPSGGGTTARALVKSRKPGFQCQSVKIGDNGNPVKVPNSKSYWFELSAIPETTEAQDTKVSEILGDGKRAFRCTLRQYNTEKSKMTSASIDDGEE